MSKLDVIIDNPAGYKTLEEALSEYIGTYEEFGQVMAQVLSCMEKREADEIANKCLAHLIKIYLNMA